MELIRDYKESYKACKIIQENDAEETKRFADRIPNYPKLRILDIGCAEGKLVEELKSRGHDVQGLDIAPRFEDCIEWDIEKGTPNIGKFDVIFLNDVLEHFLSPSIAIRNIRELLNENGKLYINTPNAFYWKRLIWSIRINKDAPTYKIGRSFHLQIYDFQSLGQMLAYAGLKITKYHGRFFPMLEQNLNIECERTPLIDSEKLSKQWENEIL